MEITPNKLKAMAGWALSKVGLASDAQAVALHKFRDGCHELADNCPESIVAPERQEVVVTETPAPRSFVVNHPQEVLQQHCDHTGQHRFDIRTQHCVWCGQSYRKVRGRKAELM